MVSFTYRMPAGIPGDINRSWAATVEPAVITPSGTAGAPTAYGVPVVIDAATGNVGNMRAFIAGSDTTVYGLLARPWPTASSQDGLGVSTPPAQGACDVLKSGYMTVLLSGSAAAVKGGQVYLWNAASSGAHVLGGFEAASDTTVVTPTRCYFMGPADAAGNVEVAFNIG